MANAIDLTGRQFGSLVVLTSVRKRMPHGYHAVLWQCQCACGTTPLVHDAALLDSSVTSCSTCNHRTAVRQQPRRTLADATTTKVCTRCRKEQPLDAFPAGLARFNRGPYCRSCQAARINGYRARKKVR